MVRTLITLLLVLFSVESLYAGNWQWQKDCQPGDKTVCEVWFNDTQQFSTFTVKAGEESLNITYKQYGDVHPESNNFIFVQTNGLNSSKLTRLQSALVKFVNYKTSFQDLALFGSNNNVVVPLSPLGSTKGELHKKIKALKVQPAMSSLDRQIIDVLNILGGTEANRKVVYWFTPGIELQAAQIQKIQKQLERQQVRLVVVHLKLSELDTNNSTSLQKLTEESNGLFVSLGSSEWETKIPQLSRYSNNGGVLTIATDDLCGENTLKFTGSLTDSSMVTKTSWKGVYAACPPPVVVPPTPKPPVVVPTTTTTSNTDTTETENGDDSTTVTQDGTEPTTTETGDSAESTPTDTENSTDSTTNDSENDNGSTANQSENGNDTTVDPDKPKSNLIIVIGAGLGILALLGAVFALRKKQKPVVQESVAFASLTSLGANGQRYPISSSVTNIGRSQDNDICLIDESISANHAVIKKERDGSINLMDLNSSNGVKVNGEDIEQVRLNSGDEIQLGESRFLFGIEG